MAEKTLKARFKHAVLGDTVTSSSVPKKGEIIFNSELDNFRVGDGTSTYANLNDVVQDGIDKIYIGNTPYTPEVDFNGHDYVDLGVVLPNGNKLLFATNNVGANTVTDYGNYYAWGETTTKSDYSWSTYTFNPSGDGFTFTKYNSTDQKVTLDPEDDPVRVNMGGNWRSPTDAELTALLNQTTNTWVTDYNGSGINGRVFTGTNGNTMFVPTAGFRHGTFFNFVGIHAYWLSSSLDSVGSAYSCRLHFDSNNCFMDDNERYDGFSARGVIEVTNGKSVFLPEYPTTLPASDTTNTYSSTGTAPVSGQAVASALGTLDGIITGSAGANKTLTAFSQTDGKVSATFGNISITKSQVSDFPTLGTAAAKDVPSSGNASATQVVLGSDSRLSDSRNAADVYAWAKASTKPSYSWTEITDKPTEFTPSSHNHDSRYYISNGAIVLGGSSITPLTQHQTLTNHAKLADTSTAGQAIVSKSGGYEWKTLGSNAFTSKTKLSEFTDDLGSSPTHTHSQYALSANLGTAAGKNYTTSVAQNSSDLVTSGAVWTAIDNLPEPMVFKGSLGTGGTITTLPAAATSNTGFTYKVITAGTYASKAAKVGDTFISTGSAWELIPSGDEPSGTVTSVGISAPTGFSVSGSPVTSSGTLTLSFASGYSLPTTAKQTNWDTAYTNSHTHSNKTVLDGISSTKVSNWDTAYSWGNHANAGYELTSRKVSSWSSTTTNTNYPTEKLVKDSLDGKQATISDLSTIRSNASNGNTAYGWGNHASVGYLTGITSSMVTTALGYTPYNATNPNGYTTNTGTVASVATTDGLTGGTITTSGTLKANLRSFTKLTNDSAAATETSGRIYPVALDKTGYLAVNVPWTDTDTKVTSASNHYSPSTESYTPTAGSWTWNSTSVVTGITKDSKGHITGVTTTAIANPNTNTTYTLTQDATDGHKITLTPSSGSATTITIPDNNTNQTIKGAGTAFGANDAVNIVAGNNVTVTPNTTDKTITIASSYTDTNQTIKGAGTAFSANDAVNIVAGSNVTVTPNTTDKTITIASSYTNNNQKVKVGDVTFGADDVVNFVAGTNVASIVGNATNKTITINTTDTNTWRPVGTGATDAAAGNHAHGNITNGGDITATAPTIANGDQLVINDNSESKITNGPTFDGSTTTKALTPKGTWETFLQSHQSLSGYVTGSSLTDDNIILGNGSSAIKTSSKSITTTAPSSSSDNTTLPTSAAVWSAISNGIAVADAMVYKGTISGGSTGSYGALTPAASKGDTYKVVTAGKIDGIAVEVGDMMICNADGTAAATSSNYTTIATKWDFIQANIDGAVTGPTSSTDAHVAVFNGATGKVIKDSGFTIGKSVPSDAVFTDTVYTLPLAADGTRGGIQLGYSQSGKNYPVQLSGEKAYVNVPWTDNNTATAENNILAGSNSGTEIRYSPYDSSTATSTWVANDNNAGKLYSGTVNPAKNTRLNYNGTFYAHRLYSDGNAVLTGITSSMVTTALGYTPYNSTNPNGYTANTGTVTSVGLSAPTGFSVSGSPVTTSGTLTLGFASGYSLPTTAKQSNWDTAYGWGNHAAQGYFDGVQWDSSVGNAGGLYFGNGSSGETVAIEFSDYAHRLGTCDGDATSEGSATKPVYFDNGTPVACTYSLNKTVPSNAVFTDTTYESKTAASGGTDVSLVTTGEKYTWNNKISSADLTTHAKVADTSTTNQVLVSSVSGNTTSYNWTTANSSLVGLGNVGNFKAVSTVANQGLSATERNNALQNLGTYIPYEDDVTMEYTIRSEHDITSRSLKFYRSYLYLPFFKAGQLSGHSLSIEKLGGNSILVWDSIERPFEDYLTSLTISSIVTSVYESVVYFLTSSSGCTLTLPSGTPVFGSTTLEANTKYVMAVRCGVVVISPEGGARISWSDILNRPTIPTVGTLNTTNTTAQSTSNSESLGGAINLHKVAKTGTYSDLIGTPTIPTVGDGTVNIYQAGGIRSTFTLNSGSNYDCYLQDGYISRQSTTTIANNDYWEWETLASNISSRTYQRIILNSETKTSLELRINLTDSHDHYLLIDNSSSHSYDITFNNSYMATKSCWTGNAITLNSKLVKKPATISIPAGKSIELSAYINAAFAEGLFVFSCSGELS